MTDPDPELQAILRKKAASLHEKVAFFDKVNRNGVTIITDANIDEIIRSSPLPVLVDFSADAWCKPCQVMGPVYEELSHEFVNQVLFVKINTDHNPQATAKYRIFSVPTFMIFNAGNRINQRSGAIQKAKFKAWIEEILHRIQKAE
ncbi:MAG: thioredoxin fold domain-containing protein [Candidatus Heimdallarchaeota archaeon]|nr:MAG: thioredoxin fold domain-containing protein [Candidatus Heimdallarchaeota archaeon]